MKILNLKLTVKFKIFEKYIQTNQLNKLHGSLTASRSRMMSIRCLFLVSITYFLFINIANNKRGSSTMSPVNMICLFDAVSLPNWGKKVTMRNLITQLAAIALEMC